MSSVKSQPSSIIHFYELDVWKDAHNLSIEIYKLTEKFPKKETYAIVDQIRRASTSVGANIAEGFGRFHYKEKIKFYYNARGSICEVQNFLFLAQDIDYLSKDIARELFIKYENLNKRLNHFINSVKKKMTDDC
ncbi:MAG: Ribosomal protein S23 [Candidatus Moranbacteria bacterium GW2011_GWF2_34_56]|nr:MAG: Ribosomal protein S23 [Candidatus Moranbacteria bacterium GW2011_GWF1_34_10]KKP63819.1 MAG: Ribosomal protein S23 [Candidatus Moranbacteria bacterium GW2011_GWF2_34_56]HBI17472.1 four helix bundle protein [Candidatus Moranbacteria bacterium]